MAGAAREPLVVLDDDPTGVQTLAGIRVLLAWDRARVRAALEGRPSVHLITNTRALPAARVRPFVAAAARAALDGVPDAAIVLRGDSTLRGHLLEEYLGVRDVVAPSGWPVLLLVPALPSAGRVTVGGVHLFERDGRAHAAARDGVRARRRVRLRERQAARMGGRALGRAVSRRRRAGAAPRRASLPRACRRDRGAARPRRHGRPGGVRARRGDGRGPRSGRPGISCGGRPRRLGDRPLRSDVRRSARRDDGLGARAGARCKGRRAGRLRLVRAAIDATTLGSARRPAGIVRRGRRRRARGQRPIRRDRRVGGRGLAPPGGESVGGACDAPRAAGRDDEPRSRGAHRRRASRESWRRSPPLHPCFWRRAGSLPR